MVIWLELCADELNIIIALGTTTKSVISCHSRIQNGLAFLYRLVPAYQVDLEYWHWNECLVLSLSSFSFINLLFLWNFFIFAYDHLCLTIAILLFHYHINLLCLFCISWVILKVSVLYSGLYVHINDVLLFAIFFLLPFHLQLQSLRQWDWMNDLHIYLPCSLFWASVRHFPLSTKSSIMLSIHLFSCRLWLLFPVVSQSLCV